MEIIKNTWGSLNSDRLHIAFLVAINLMIGIDLLDSNLIAKIHALHFYTNTYLQVKVAYLIIGTALITALTYVLTPKNI